MEIPLKHRYIPLAIRIFRPPKISAVEGLERLGVVGERRPRHVSAGEASAGLSRLRSAGGVLDRGWIAAGWDDGLGG